MAHIQRLYDFQAGTKIISSQVDAEFNQLISYVNGLDDANGVLAGATGATKVGVGEGGNLQTLLDKLVRFATANIKHIRLNEDKVIETSANGVDWEASGSSGHSIQRANGEILTQRSRLQFLNTTITDDAANNRTVIQGLVGPTGPQGIQGPGLPAGGTAGQIITKVDATDYNTAWTTPEEPNFAFSGTLNNTSWTGSSAPYTKAVTVTGILAAGKTPTVDVVLSTTWATALTEEAEWAKIKRIAYTNDTLTFYATKVPTVSLNFKGVQPK